MLDKWRQFEFEARIFISFSIILVICLLSFLAYPGTADNILIIGNWFGLAPDWAQFIGYLFVALLMVVASFIRMWAGSILSSQRMMSFRVRKDKLTMQGPYVLVRNPIYLADLIAYCGFALCLKPVALAMPIVLYIHYTQLIIYEEQSLRRQFGERFDSYKARVPRILPDLRSIRALRDASEGLLINKDGFRHNALYMLFIPGFVVASIFGSLLYAILIGLPAVVDWAIVHTRKGITRQAIDDKIEEKSEPVKAVAQKKVFADILYAQCWEDPEIDRAAFNINHDDVVFSITSGGCNVLAFLIDNPRKIISLDLNPFQNYLLDLKMAAFKTLSYDTMLEFLGVIPSTRRLELYSEIRPYLMEESRAYWDEATNKIDAGVIHSGRYEFYMHLLRKWFCRLMGKSLPVELFATNSISERKSLYEKKWNNSRWRFFTRVLLSRSIMTFLFDKAFFLQLESSFSFGVHFRGIIKRAVVDLPLKENNFLAYILLGRFYSLRHLPVYLRKENFDIIRRRVDRIEPVCASCEDYFVALPPNYISRFNFTNIFEWMPKNEVEKLLRETVRVAKNGAVVTYRNLLVPRARPASLAGCIEQEKDLAAELHKRDLSFIYRAYVVERIRKK